MDLLLPPSSSETGPVSQGLPCHRELGKVGRREETFVSSAVRCERSSLKLWASMGVSRDDSRELGSTSYWLRTVVTLPCLENAASVYLVA
jgi:hypothetical protein